MPTSKQLDLYSTILGWILILMAFVMFWLPLVITLKKDLIEQWWWPVGTLVCGVGMVFSRENFFKAVDSFFKRKSNSL